MRRLSTRDIIWLLSIGVLFCLLFQSWGAIVGFVKLVLTAIVPLVLGAAIAYVIAIPTGFLERHLLPNSTSPIIQAIRRPVALVITIVNVLLIAVLLFSVLIPALIETISMVQLHAPAFIAEVLRHPIFAPVRDAVQDFMAGDFFQSLLRLDFSSIMTVFGGNVGTITSGVFGVVSTIMTCFFGTIFSFILLTDTTDVGNGIMRVSSQLLGEERTERIAHVIGVADATFHNFIVRQCVEALILGAVGTSVLLLVHYDYAWGVGALMGLSALVPIVGYPIGLFAGAFMVVIDNGVAALLYVVCVAVAQMLEANLLLPHMGDPRTVLPPVWVTVAVTIGGGVAGFGGMLVAIPVASTIRQLVLLETRNRLHKKGIAIESEVE